MTTTQTDKSMAALADILRQNGVEVGQVCEANSDPIMSSRSEIIFYADKDAAQRAADLALELGYPLIFLECIWQVIGGVLRRDTERWIMIFTTL